MRADRLVATLLLLQARGRVTAAELAAELEVSVATARRDLEALSTAGIPVYPQSGRHGGWSLVGGARTDLSGLSATEATALFRLAGPAAAVSGEAKAALRKLLQALPAPFRTQASAAAGATHLDPAAWGFTGRDRPPLVDALHEAVVQCGGVRFTYRQATRDADPWGLIDKDGLWYLIAGTARGRRTFRVDRISGLARTGETFTRPADLDLSAVWAEVVAEMERRRAEVQAVVLIPTRFVWVLRDHFGRHCEVVGETDNDHSRVRVGAPTARDIARTLSGWGATVEVVSPESVRAELHRIGTELAGLYGPGSRPGPHRR